MAGGKKTKRAGLDRVRDLLRKGDVLVIWRLDRLGQSLKHLIELNGLGGWVSEPPRSDQYHLARRHARVSHLRGDRRIRAEPDP